MAGGTLKDLRARIAAARVAVEAALPAIAEEFASTAKAISERNIIEEGFGETYSTKLVPAFFLHGKHLNQSGEAYLKRKAKAKEGVNWSGFKEAQGLPVDHVTLSYTNEMWRGLHVVRVVKQGSKTLAVLGGTTQAGQDKLNWNFARYGDFILKGLKEDDRRFLVNDIIIDGLLQAIKQNV